MASDTEIKKAFYEYGRKLARNMGEGVDVSDDEAIEAAWDEVCDTSMMYSESLEFVADKLESGLGDSYSQYSKRLGLNAEMARGWKDQLKDA